MSKAVTYFAFITDIYFAEASWPEIANAVKQRRQRTWLRSPFQIWRVVGDRLERRYVAQEIESERDAE